MPLHNVLKVRPEDQKVEYGHEQDPSDQVADSHRDQVMEVTPYRDLG